MRVSVKGWLAFGALQMPFQAHPNDSGEHAERAVQIDLEEHAQLSELLVQFSAVPMFSLEACSSVQDRGRSLSEFSH